MEKVLDAAPGDKLAAVEGLPTLDSLAREGAWRMLLMALEEEVARYVDAHDEARDEAGRRLVVRNGRGQARSVTCGTKRSGDGACRGATTSTCGSTGSTSTSGWKTTGCARW